ncbi:MAG: hypothetical protein GY862_21310 [Gammaproteobacteria bacterium]|nr:hypothetical protein [Gammaproteobacteria bacterium]
MNRKPNPAFILPFVIACTFITPFSALSHGGKEILAGYDWNNVPARETVLFYPGQSSLEWALGRDHGGAKPFKFGKRCFDCHDKKTADIGRKIVSDEKLEPNPIPGKRGSIPVTVQAAHDGEYLYLRFRWPDAEHAPVPFAEGGKMDPGNPIKLAIMLAADNIKYANRAGCWGTCHHDLRTMPGAPDAKTLNAAGSRAKNLNFADGVTKYLTESRTRVEIRGHRGRPLGGWDKLKKANALQRELKAGHFMDLLGYKSGTKETQDGYILSERIATGGQGISAAGELKDGQWTVSIRRKLVSNKPGDLALATDRVYNIDFAIHDDYSNARYHHVSVGYKLGFDNRKAEINAVRR